MADHRGAMGLAVGDWDNDADLDIFVTHWIAQEKALYTNQLAQTRQAGAPALRFLDEADQYGLGQIALDYVGWGTSFFDYDNDGRLDLSGLESLVNERTKVLAFVHVSNILGTENPVDVLVARADDAGVSGRARRGDDRQRRRGADGVERVLGEEGLRPARLRPPGRPGVADGDDQRDPVVQHEVTEGARSPAPGCGFARNAAAPGDRVQSAQIRRFDDFAV